MLREMGWKVLWRYSGRYDAWLGFSQSKVVEALKG